MDVDVDEVPEACARCAGPIEQVGPADVEVNIVRHYRCRGACREGGHAVFDGNSGSILRVGGPIFSGRPTGMEARADGGTFLDDDGPRRVPWPFEAVAFGHNLSPQCMAVTSAGDPCSNTVLANAVWCGLHEQTDDPDTIPGAHQWARITDRDYDAPIWLCVRCEQVWIGGHPAAAVDCSACGATAGDSCKRHGGSASVPPHRERRVEAYNLVDGYGRCPESPSLASPNDDQVTFLDLGGGDE
jgi:ribosomal protein S27E